MRPCDLLPGISMLAIRPAASPRTIQAIIPTTDSLSKRRGNVRGNRSRPADREETEDLRQALGVVWPSRLGGIDSVHKKNGPAALSKSGATA
jgi:hypothetical protein